MSWYVPGKLLSSVMVWVVCPLLPLLHQPPFPHAEPCGGAVPFSTAGSLGVGPGVRGGGGGIGENGGGAADVEGRPELVFLGEGGGGAGPFPPSLRAPSPPLYNTPF